ncbi:MAG: tetratricopeptide repeat protein [candidate division Zixibacteria bacterium]|nr:tetratricopeptide repeat protein [candidate division Zixibacteria bacterium]
MDSCSDAHYRELLAAYELGMLDDVRLRDLELHLLECDVCFAEAERFREAARLLRKSPRIREMVSDTYRESGPQQPATSSRSVRRLVTTWLAAAAALLILVLRPWHIEIHPSDFASAAETRVAVKPFWNSTGQANQDLTGRVIASLLSADLSRVSGLQVVSTQRVHDVGANLARESREWTHNDIVASYARLTDANWVITGDILSVDSGLVLTFELSDAASQSVVAAETITAQRGEDMFAVVDRMTAQIGRHFRKSSVIPDRSVADVTTHSFEAYRNYVAGLDNYYKLYWSEALEYFNRAVELDSTFAMAYYYLVRLGQRDVYDAMVRYADNVSSPEQHRIRSLILVREGNRSAAIEELRILLEKYPDDKEILHQIASNFYAVEQLDSAEVYWNESLRLDSYYKTALNHLAYLYARTDRYDQAIVAINRYIDIAPNEANPYDTRAEIYSWYGRLDDAAASYRQALAIKPDFYSSLAYLGYMSLFAGDYVTADSCFDVLTTLDSDVLRPAGRLYQSYSPLHRGQYALALRGIDSAVVANKAELAIDRLRPLDMVYIYVQRAYALHEAGAFDSAVASLELAAQYCGKRSIVCYRQMMVQYLADGGHMDRAAVVLEQLRADLGDKAEQSPAYWYAAGCLALARGNHQQAVDDLETSWSLAADFKVSYMLGRAYLTAGRLSRAVRQWERTARIYDSPRASMASWSAKTHYFLGRVYEESRWYDRAAEQYEQFLEIFRGADDGISEVDDARARLDRIRRRS